MSAGKEALGRVLQQFVEHTQAVQGGSLEATDALIDRVWADFRTAVGHAQNELREEGSNVLARWREERQKRD